MELDQDRTYKNERLVNQLKAGLMITILQQLGFQKLLEIT